MNRQLMKACLVALLISLTASFSPYPNKASSLKDASSKRAAFRDAISGCMEIGPEVAAYDAVHQQILHMADGLGMGIINQFPNKFE